MIPYNVPINAQRMTIGVQGENNVREFLFDVTEWRQLTGDIGTAEMVIQRRGDSSPYAAVITMHDENTVSWIPVSADTAKAGAGKIQLMWIANGQTVKTKIFDMKVDPALDYQLPDDSLDPWASWMPGIINADANYKGLTAQVNDLQQMIASPYKTGEAVADMEALNAIQDPAVNEAHYVISERCRYGWTGTTWTQVSMKEIEYADELAAVSGEMDRLSRNILVKPGFTDTGSWTLNKYRNSNGTLVTKTGYAISASRDSIRRKALVLHDTAYQIGVTCYTGKPIESSTYITTLGWFDAETVVCFPENTGAFTVQVHKIDDTAITNADIEALRPSIEYLAATDTTLTIPGAAADAEAAGTKIDALGVGLHRLAMLGLTESGAAATASWTLDKYRDETGVLITKSGYAISGSMTTSNKKALVMQDADFAVAVTCYSDKPISGDNRIETSPWYDAGEIIFLPSKAAWFTMQIRKLDGTAVTSEDIAAVREQTRFYVQTNAGLEAKLQILALGDSICRGGRNSSKGFVGDLGLPYINMGVGGATVSNIRSTYADSIHSFSDADNVPNQLVSYFSKTDDEIQAAFGKTKFTPDVIIGEGGINDYINNAALGTMSGAPVSADAEAAELDRNTLLGALEYLFYQMIKLYPMAQRYFVITHKTCRANGSYYPTRVNSAGYTQQQMHDAIVACCNLYSVVPIDVYRDGLMDTKFPRYRAAAENYHQAAPTDYCDYDGVHPLSYGYQQVYVPMVKAALQTATKKDEDSSD